MKRLICVIFLVCFMSPMILVSSVAAEQDLVEYIAKNVDTLADVYLQLHPDSDVEFLGTSVEFSIPVTIVSTDEIGTYLDFDGDNGYMVIADGDDVIKWEPSGDLEYLKDLNTTSYSIIDGFGYYTENEFVPFESNLADVNDCIQNSAYIGQVQAGDGTIYDCEKYIIDRYSSHYKLVTTEYLPYDFEYVNQFDLSIYRTRDSNGVLKSEGNCALAAVYALLNYLESSGKCPNFPASSSKISYDATNDSFYSKYAGKSNYDILNPIQLNTLYYAVRYWAIKNYGYEVSGFFSGNYPGLIEKVASVYGEKIDAKQHTLGSFETYVKKELNEGNPVLFSVDMSETYGSHGLVVTGYHTYAKTTTVLGIDFVDYVHLLRVNDNWAKVPRYFDWTAFSGTWSFVTVEVTE